MYDIAIIGGGIIGTSIARALMRFQLRVILLEKNNDVAGGTSKANSAIVHAGYDAPFGTKKAYYNKKGSDMYEQLCQDLDVHYKRVGSFVVATKEEDRSVLEALKANGEKLGIKGLRLVDRDFIKAREAHLAEHAIMALYAPTAAITDPFGLTIACMENAMDNGATLSLNFKVDAIDDLGTHYRIKSRDHEVDCRYIINAAGLYGDEIYKMIDPSTTFTIHPRRGQYYLLDKTARHLVHSVIFQCPGPMGKGVAIAPTVDGNVLIGPDSEDLIDKTSDETTSDQLRFVRDSAAHVVDSIPYSENITTFAGLRAEPSTDDFLIEAINDRAYNVIGIKSPGLSAAPAIAEEVAEAVAQKLDARKNKSFNPIRHYVKKFSEMDSSEKMAMIQRNPTYGHVVCRCETITEGEIIDAIHRNCGGQTVNGIKRRVRPGAGRCQGGFCMPKVIAILARELHVKPTEILKENKGSTILTKRTKGGASCTKSSS